jgi:hypothetical protein
MQCGPRGSWPARLAGIQRARQRAWPGKGGERVPTSQGFVFGAWPGAEEGRRVVLPAAGGGGRKELGSGELSARDRKRAARTALCGPRGGTRMVEPTGKPVGGGFHRDGGHGEGGGVTETQRCLSARGKGASTPL